MELRDQPDHTPTDERALEYEPPVVEDIDTSHGPLVTPSGGATRIAVPRGL